MRIGHLEDIGDIGVTERLIDEGAIPGQHDEIIFVVGEWPSQQVIACSLGEPARLGDVTLQIVRDWAVRFNTEGPEGLNDRKSVGPTPRLTDAHRAALLEIIDRGPTPAIHGVGRWRLSDLGQWLREEFRVSVSPQGRVRQRGGNLGVVWTAIDHAAIVAIWFCVTSMVGAMSSAIGSVCM